MYDLPGRGWHIFSTHDVPWRIARPCLERNAKIVEKTYAWANNHTCPETVQGLSTHEDVQGLLVTREPFGDLPIYDIPYQVGEAQRVWLNGDKTPEPPDWIAFHDDDDTFPLSEEFPQYLADWIESDSQVMHMRQFYLWHHSGVIRVDGFRTVGFHARYVKVPKDGKPLRWWKPYQTRCRPHVDEAKQWACPWPLLHYTVFDEEMRDRYHERNRMKSFGGAKGGREDRRFWVNDPDATLMRLDPELKELDYCKIIRDVDGGRPPEGTWKHGDGSWLEDFK